MVIFRYLHKLATHSNHPVIQQLENYAYLIRLDRPIGILLLLWPTLWALWIAAKGLPDVGVLLVFVFGVFFMRSAGCAINDYADRKVDGHVSRTQNRPIVSGKVSPKEALLVFIVLASCAFMLVLFMNALTIYLSFVGAALAASYPFMKRYHFLPQVHLGAAFGWAVPMAYAAQSNEITPLAWLLFLATVLWATAYDTMYAMADRDDDIKIGVKSTAILFGEADRIMIAIIQLMLIFTLLMIGNRAELGMFYYTGIFIAALFALYQQFLIRNRDAKLCIEAFLNNNWFGMAVFFGIVLDYFFNK
ncbi:MAG: 4-hydroxybenzoate octaprenyltransferase [Gammaproteobacteria bacterium]|nr:4-hydroxybenzoate octaprenyltransferase [Gammaproteobacteria bacterium]